MDIRTTNGITIKKILCYVITFAMLLGGLAFAGDTTSKAASKEKFKKVITITSKKYGAKSGKDATKAIQKALDDAGRIATKKMRVQVVIPKGTFYISSTLRISSNTYLKCKKGAKIVKKKKTFSSMLKVKNTTKTGGTNAFANITVDGGCWDAKYLKKSKKSGGSIMYFTHINNLVITNAKLCHVYGASHMIEIGAADKVSISNCEFFGYKSPNPVGCKEAIQLDVSHCEDIEPDAKPYDDTPCSNVVIENNYIHDCGRGIGSHSAVKNVYHKQITIRKNRIANTMSEGIYLLNYLDSTISNNTITNAPVGISLHSFNPSVETNYTDTKKNAKTTKLNDNSYNLNISDNTITTTNKKLNASDTQIGIYISATPEYPVNKFTIKSNTISCVKTGILMRNSSGNTITSNVIKRLNNSSSGSITSVGMEFTGCSHNDVSYNKINFGKANKFDNCISLRGQSVANTLLSNELSFAKGSCINISSGSDADVMSCSINKSGKDGISVHDGSLVNLSDVKISNSTRSGIFVNEKSTVNIFANGKPVSIDCSGANGIHITDGSKADITNLVVTNSKEYGCFVYNKSSLTLKKSEIKKSGSHGISVNNANAKIDDVKSISNSGYGIIFSNASTGYVQNSYIDSNKKTGVYVNDSTLTRINANKIINHTTRGMDVTGSTVTEICNNTFDNPNASCEMRIYDSNVPKGMESLNHNDKDLKKDNWGNSVGK